MLALTRRQAFIKPWSSHVSGVTTGLPAVRVVPQLHFEDTKMPCQHSFVVSQCKPLPLLLRTSVEVDPRLELLAICANFTTIAWRVWAPPERGSRYCTVKYLHHTFATLQKTIFGISCCELIYLFYLGNTHFLFRGSNDAIWMDLWREHPGSTFCKESMFRVGTTFLSSPFVAIFCTYILA